MSDLMKALPHLAMATIVIAAVVLLTLSNKISGADALPVIVVVGGFTLGGTVASGSISTVAGVANENSPPGLHLTTPTPNQAPTAPTTAPPTAT